MLISLQNETTDMCVVYLDLWVSIGMQAGINYTNSIKKPIEYRFLGLNWDLNG